MSVRENIASELLSTISAISSPAIKKASRQPFILDELSEQQYPAVIVQTSEENRDCLLYTSPSPRDRTRSRMPSSA